MKGFSRGNLFRCQRKKRKRGRKKKKRRKKKEKALWKFKLRSQSTQIIPKENGGNLLRRNIFSSVENKLLLINDESYYHQRMCCTKQTSIRLGRIKQATAFLKKKKIIMSLIPKISTMSVSVTLSSKPELWML